MCNLARAVKRLAHAAGTYIYCLQSLLYSVQSTLGSNLVVAHSVLDFTLCTVQRLA